MFRPPQCFHATHEFLLFGFALIVTDHELLVFFSHQVMTCSCVGPVAITVLHRDRQRQHRPSYPGRQPSRYRFLIGITHRDCFGQHYLQTLSRGLAGYSIALRASELSMFLSEPSDPKHVKATIPLGHPLVVVVVANNNIQLVCHMRFVRVFVFVVVITKKHPIWRRSLLSSQRNIQHGGAQSCRLIEWLSTHIS